MSYFSIFNGINSHPYLIFDFSVEQIPSHTYFNRFNEIKLLYFPYYCIFYLIDHQLYLFVSLFNGINLQPYLILKFSMKQISNRTFLWPFQMKKNRCHTLFLPLKWNENPQPHLILAYLME